MTTFTDDEDQNFWNGYNAVKNGKGLHDTAPTNTALRDKLEKILNKYALANLKADETNISLVELDEDTIDQILSLVQANQEPWKIESKKGEPSPIPDDLDIEEYDQVEEDKNDLS